MFDTDTWIKRLARILVAEVQKHNQRRVAANLPHSHPLCHLTWTFVSSHEFFPQPVFISK